MAKTYEHLGLYSDLVAAAKRSHRLYPVAPPGKVTRKRLLEALSFEPRPVRPRDVTVEKRWEKNGVSGEAITWWVGYGPRTEAWLLRPAGVGGRLPAVLALHDHGGFKYYGKEKIAEGPGRVPRTIPQRYDKAYGGRAFANELARRGFAVLVHDIFLFGSRRFPKQQIPQRYRQLGGLLAHRAAAPGRPMTEHLYNQIAGHHEANIGACCRLLGTSIAGVANYEDRVAAAYLTGRKDVRKGGIGCVGLSGGGIRSTLLAGTSNGISCAVVVGAMYTYESLFDHNVANHGADNHVPGTWPLIGDWPDIAAAGAPSPLMVQNNLQDPLFTLAGMKAADRRIAANYRAAGKPRNYAGRFYPGPHKFDIDMQEDAFEWLTRHLG